MEGLLENFGTYIELAIKVVGVFAVIATMTANDTDNKIAQFILDLINKLGMNIGNAKNAD